MPARIDPEKYRELLLGRIEKLRKQLQRMDAQERAEVTHIEYQLREYERAYDSTNYEAENW